MRTPFIKNPKFLAVVNRPKKKKRRSVSRRRKVKKRATAPRRLTVAKKKTRRLSPGRKTSKRRNNPPGAKSRRKSARRNPLLPTKLMQQALTLGAGYLAAPIVSSMVPWQPATKLGQYAKTALVVTLGGQIVNKVAGKKYGNALMAGGWLWIAVDALSSQLTFFAPAQAAGEDNLGYYFPPDSDLVAGNYDPMSIPAPRTGVMPRMLN